MHKSYRLKTCNKCKMKLPGDMILDRLCGWCRMGGG